MELILDYSKWRCGGTGANSLGQGFTSMLNTEGYSCCLGQFAPQLNSEIESGDLLYLAYPRNIHKETLILVSENGLESKLSLNAININDDPYTTPQQKIEALKELFGREGITIKVINQ